MSDLFSHPDPPPPQLVRLDRNTDRLRPCCQNLAVVVPRPDTMHQAELRCAACGKHRGWLRHEALAFLAEVSARFGSPTEPITLRDTTIGDRLMSDKHYEPKNGQGALFRNTRKKEPAEADYQGALRVENIDFTVSGWIKVSKAGAKYLFVSAMPKGEGRPVSNKSDDLDDQIGF